MRIEAFKRKSSQVSKFVKWSVRNVYADDPFDYDEFLADMVDQDTKRLKDFIKSGEISAAKVLFEERRSAKKKITTASKS